MKRKFIISALIFAMCMAPMTGLAAGQTVKNNSIEVKVSAHKERQAQESPMIIGLTGRGTSKNTRLRLEWTVGTTKDSPKITGYAVFVEGEKVKTVTKPQYTKEGRIYTYVDGLEPGREYECKVAPRLRGEKDSFYGEKVAVSARTAPAPVTKLGAKAVTDKNSVKLTWTAPKGCDPDLVTYQIYKKCEGDAEFVPAGTSSSTNKTITGLKWGKEYTFGIKAFVKNEDTRSYSSMTEADAIKVVPDKPSIEAIHNSFDRVQVNLQWPDGAEGLKLYYRKKGASDWIRKVSLTNTATKSYLYQNLACGQEYEFCAEAYIKNGETIYSGPTSEVSSWKTVPSGPSLSTSSGDGKVTIKWENVRGATAYRVYRKLPGGTFTLLKELNGNASSYTDTSVSAKTKYLYTVKAMHKDIAGRCNSGLEGAVLAPSTDVTSIIVTSGGKATIRWNAVKGVDGYVIYRKAANETSWTKTGTADASASSYSETGANPAKRYSYLVKPCMKLNGKEVAGKTGNSLEPTLTYSGSYVTNVEKVYMGLSGAGRKMYYFKVGNGKNHFVMNAAVHGFEDSWKRDSVCMIKTAEQLIQYAAARIDELEDKNYALYILPLANPDGFYDGTTNNGPGRCTTYRFNASGALVKGGLDINRSFPSGFSAHYNDRNYTGPSQLMSRESKLIRSWVDASRGNGRSIYVDLHGWENSILSDTAGSGLAYNAFHKYFPGARAKAHGTNGYISGYAKSGAGYTYSTLFEMPWTSSEAAYNNAGYAMKYINSVWYMVMN